MAVTGEEAGFDFEVWCETNAFHPKLTELLRDWGFTEPGLLLYLSEEDKQDFTAEGVPRADVRKLEQAILRLPSPQSALPHCQEDDIGSQPPLQDVEAPSCLDEQDSSQDDAVVDPEDKYDCVPDNAPTSTARSTQETDCSKSTVDVSPPEDLTVAMDETSVTVAWQPPQGTGRVDGYLVRLSCLTTPLTEGTEEYIGPSKTPSITYHSLEPGVQYEVTVVARSAGLESEPVGTTFYTDEIYDDVSEGVQQPHMTNGQETKASETNGPETKAPETRAPETEGPETEGPDEIYDDVSEGVQQPSMTNGPETEGPSEIYDDVSEDFPTSQATKNPETEPLDEIYDDVSEDVPSLQTQTGPGTERLSSTKTVFSPEDLNEPVATTFCSDDIYEDYSGEVQLSQATIDAETEGPDEIYDEVSEEVPPLPQAKTSPETERSKSTGVVFPPMSLTVVDNNETSVTVTWQPPRAPGEVDGYLARLSRLTPPCTEGTTRYVNQSESLSITYHSLEPSVQYEVTVVAKSAGLESEPISTTFYTDVMYIELSEEAPPLPGRTGQDTHHSSSTAAVPLPEGLTVEDNDETSVTVTWQPPKSPGRVDSYLVRLSRLTPPSDDGIAEEIEPSETPSVTYHSLDPGVQYEVTVVARSAALESKPVVTTFYTGEVYDDTLPSYMALPEFMTDAPLYQEIQTAKTAVLVRDDRDGSQAVRWQSTIAPKWDRQPQVVENNVKYTLSKQQQHLQEAMFEVLTTEESYIRSMSVLEEHFLQAILQENALVGHGVFSCLSRYTRQILEVSVAFLEDLQRRVKEQSPVVSDICDIIEQHALKNFLDPYKTYCKEVNGHSRVVKKVISESKDVREQVSKLESDPRCSRLPLTSFLMLPMQRITRLPLLIERILSNREDDSDSFQSAMKALQDTQKVASIINEAVRDEERNHDFEGLVQERLSFDRCKLPFPLRSKTRWIVKQGDITWIKSKEAKTSSRSQRYIIVLTDLLLVAKKRQKRGGGVIYDVLNYCMRNRVQADEVSENIYDETSVVKKPVATRRRSFLDFFKMQQASLDEGYKFNVLLLEDKDGQEQEMVFSVASPSERTRWIEAFQYSTTDGDGGAVYSWDFPLTSVKVRRDATQSDELAFEAGDVVKVLRKMPDGMWYGETTHDARQGWFPCECVEEIRDSDHYKAKQLRKKRASSTADQVSTQGQDSQKFVALYDFDPSREGELQLREGQELEILDFGDNIWYQARLVGTQEVGNVPYNYVEPIRSLQQEDWYFGRLSRKETEELLLAPGTDQGAFLVREVHNTQGQGSHVYTLSVKARKDGDDVVRHFKVDRSPAGKLSAVPEQEFNSIQELVSKITEEGRIGKSCKIGQPCPKPRREDGLSTAEHSENHS